MLRRVVLSLAFATAAAFPALASDHVMAGFYGNTAVATGGMADTHTAYSPDHTFVMKVPSFGVEFKGTWVVDASSTLCRDIPISAARRHQSAVFADRRAQGGRYLVDRRPHGHAGQRHPVRRIAKLPTPRSRRAAAFLCGNRQSDICAVPYGDTQQSPLEGGQWARHLPPRFAGGRPSMRELLRITLTAVPDRTRLRRAGWRRRSGVRRGPARTDA